MKSRLKHKLAWHLRKWAQWLEPQPLVRVDRPLQYRGKEYEIYPLRLELDLKRVSWGTFPDKYDQEALDYEYRRGADAIGMAVKHQVEVIDEEGPGGDRVILQLLTLKRVNP